MIDVKCTNALSQGSYIFVGCRLPGPPTRRVKPGEEACISDTAAVLVMCTIHVWRTTTASYVLGEPDGPQLVPL